jgi:hypothetical protein
MARRSQPRRRPAVARSTPAPVAAVPSVAAAPLQSVSTAPALGLSGVTWSWLYLGAFWLVSYFHIPTPDKLAPVILILFGWSVIYLFYRLCVRWPLAGYLLWCFITGLLGMGRPWRGGRW